VWIAFWHNSRFYSVKSISKFDLVINSADSFDILVIAQVNFGWQWLSSHMIATLLVIQLSRWALCKFWKRQYIIPWFWVLQHSAAHQGALPVLHWFKLSRASRNILVHIELMEGILHDVCNLALTEAPCVEVSGWGVPVNTHLAGAQVLVVTTLIPSRKSILMR